MGKLFVIVAADFDYNDEVFSPLEGNAGHPVIAYKKQAKAEQECRKKSINWLRNCGNLWEYGYGTDAISCEMEDFKKILSLETTVPECSRCKRKFKKNENFCPEDGERRARDVDCDEPIDFSAYSDEVLAKVIPLLSFEPYHVKEIEVGD